MRVARGGGRRTSAVYWEQGGRLNGREARSLPLPLPRPQILAKPPGHSWSSPASLAPARHLGASAPCGWLSSCALLHGPHTHRSLTKSSQGPSA